MKMKQKKIQFDIILSDNLPDILLLDEIRIRQILLNLVGNAFKFTDTGRISVNASASRRFEVSNSVFVDLSIEVSDTGIGIPKEYQEIIFQAFKQQDDQDSRKYGGTGLGLAITKRLVEIMDGKISLKSKYGAGSTFKVLIPRVHVGSAKYPEKKPKTPEIRNILFHDATILIADDVETHRELIKGIIKGKNIKIIEAVDGEDTIEKVLSIKPDLLVLDLNMPKASGFQVAQFMRGKRDIKNIPIVAISATRLTVEESAKAKLFDAFISKPFTVKYFINVLMKYIPYTADDAKDKLSKTEPDVLTNNHFSIKKEDQEKFKLEINSLITDLIYVSESSSFDEIMNFGNKIKSISDHFRIKQLSAIAIKILDASRNYDIERINELLSELPELLRKLLNEIEDGIRD